MAVLVPRGVVVFGLDDTSERRRGARMQVQGIDRDPVRSSRAHVVQVSGLRWQCCLRLTHRPWAQRVWALPFMPVLCPSERFYEQRHRLPRTMVERAWQIIRLVVRWLPQQAVGLVADSRDAVLELLHPVHTLSRASLMTRLRLDAALYEPPAPREPGQRGRPRLTGARRPTLEAVLADEETLWTPRRIEQGYGDGPREVEVCTATALWYPNRQAARTQPLGASARPQGHVRVAGLTVDPSPSDASAEAELVYPSLGDGSHV